MSQYNNIKNSLEWHLKQRSSSQELVARGILLPIDICIMTGQNDVDDISTFNKNKKIQLRKLLNRRLSRKQRLSREDLQARNIIIPTSFDDAWLGNKKQQRNRSHSSDDLLMHLLQRPSKYEMAESGRVDPLEFILDHEQVVAEHEKDKEKIKNKLDHKLQVRPSRYEIAETGLIDPLEFILDHAEVRKQEKKERKEIRNSLERKLNPKRRLSLLDLEQRGIIQEDEMNQNLYELLQQKEIDKHNIMDLLKNYLEKRPSPQEIQQRGIANLNALITIDA